MPPATVAPSHPFRPTPTGSGALPQAQGTFLPTSDPVWGLWQPISTSQTSPCGRTTCSKPRLVPRALASFAPLRCLPPPSPCRPNQAQTLALDRPFAPVLGRSGPGSGAARSIPGGQTATQTVCCGFLAVPKRGQTMVHGAVGGPVDRLGGFGHAPGPRPCPFGGPRWPFLALGRANGDGPSGGECGQA